MNPTTWMIRDTRSGEILWSKTGGSLPDMATSPEEYQVAFHRAFPEAIITWGKGPFNLMVTGVDCGTKMLCSLAAFNCVSPI